MTFSQTWGEVKFSTIYSLKNVPHGISVSVEKTHNAWFHFPHRGGRMTPNPPLNGEITKPTCHGGTVLSGLSPPAWLPHKGHQRSAETAPSQGLSVGVWAGECVHTEERRRVADLLLTGQFQPVGPDGPVWPLIPQAVVQLSICLHTQHGYIAPYISMEYSLFPNCCFRFEFWPKNPFLNMFHVSAWAH